MLQHVRNVALQCIVGMDSDILVLNQVLGHGNLSMDVEADMLEKMIVRKKQLCHQRKEMVKLVFELNRLKYTDRHTRNAQRKEYFRKIAITLVSNEHYFL
jgi:hypothetical protein